MTDRTWAAGLTQEEFNREFMMRFPYSDVIPDVGFYTLNVQSENRAMTPFNPEQMVEEDGIPEKKEEEAIADYKTCPACGKQCATPNGKQIGFKKHMRYCKANIKSK